MSRPVLKVGNYTPEEIKALFRDDEKYTIGIRLYAVYQVAKGQPSRKLEDLYNTSFKQITNWVHRFEKEGVAGLKDKPGRGRTACLSQEQRERLSNLLSKEPPADHGYNSATWTGPMLFDLTKSLPMTMKSYFKLKKLLNCPIQTTYNPNNAFILANTSSIFSFRSLDTFR
ncbi:helix-turn-helix domain-containing protein [Mucilaginibacter oryzae]|nr:helix-turn-helix domain-containing protein [Mucilaginibacter oryzae]